MNGDNASVLAERRILTYSTLFPNAEQPRHGIFIEARLRELRTDYPVVADVVAPIPWFPLRSRRLGFYSRYARVPRRERRDGIDVWHPRYAVVPKLTWHVAPALMFAGTRSLVRSLHRERRYDLIDAHYFYPDGVAAVLLGRELGVPVVITARGSDITLLPRHYAPRRMIQWAAAQAAGIVTVCAALRDALIELGVPAERVCVLRNGVDLEMFAPVANDTLRQQLAIGRRRMLLSVGNLIELKGHHISIEALRSLQDCVLVLVGEGPERSRLEALARDLDVVQRVRFLGIVPQADLKAYYSAADALVLASRSEGWANVLLEAMACGCPVIASRVWGTPEVVTEPAAGVLMDERTPAGLIAAYAQLFSAYPDREATRLYAEQFDWHATSRGQYELMSRIVEQRRASHGRLTG